MQSEIRAKIQYSLFDPTGNITALVESYVPEEEIDHVSALIMDKHPEVEQVGFLDPVGPALRMAGGEFCGNAAMSAAALYLLSAHAAIQSAHTVQIRVYGVKTPLRVFLSKDPNEAESFRATVEMPQACITEETLVYEALKGKLPFVQFPGISHLIIEEGSPLFALRKDREKAELAVREFAKRLSCGALGLIFVSDLEEGGIAKLSPLVYVEPSRTLIWENACASGTAAAGMALARKSGTAVDLSFEEPGGILRVKSDPEKNETFLSGQTRRTARFRY